MSSLTPLARRVAASAQLAAAMALVDDARSSLAHDAPRAYDAWQINLANISFEIETVIEGLANDTEVDYD